MVRLVHLLALAARCSGRPATALSVVRGRPRATQHAAIHESLTGPGRPRWRADAQIRPQVRHTSSSESWSITRLSQPSRSSRVRGPRHRISAHCQSSPTVTKVTHHDVTHALPEVSMPGGVHVREELIQFLVRLKDSVLGHVLHRLHRPDALAPGKLLNRHKPCPPLGWPRATRPGGR